MALRNRPNEALEATGHSVRFLVGVDLDPVARASAWAFGSSVIVATEHLLYAASEVIKHDEYDLGGHS